MSGRFNRTIADNAVIAANAVKLDSIGKLASDNPALLTEIV